MALSVSLAEFLKAIWGDGHGWAELTAIGKTGVKSLPWSYPGALDALVASSEIQNKDANVYMGVCLRREKWPRATGRIGVDGKPIFEFRGTEENALSSCAVWTEFDFPAANGQGHKGRVVDPETARKMLSEFPLKPSIVIRSGGGIQVYWLLKEAATNEDLWRVKATNKAIVKHFTVTIDGKEYGADDKCVDLARILRIPGSTNHKYDPPRPCEISFWRPDMRYTLDDFDFLPIGNIEKGAVVPGANIFNPGQAPPAQQGQPTPGQRALPSIVLDPGVVAFVTENVQALWLPGHKHDLAVLVAGMLAHAGVAMESAVEIVKTVSDRTNSDTDKRLKDVLGTYNKFVAGGEVAGRTSLEKLIDQNWSQDAKPKAMARIGAITKRLPKPPRAARNGGGGDGDGENALGAEPDFAIPKLVKFDSRPARWRVTIRKTDGEELFPEVETVNLMSFRLFQGATFEEVHVMLMDITQRRWRMLLSAAEIEVVETPKEARPEGAVETALEEFLEEARENPELGMLSAFPGYDEESRFFLFGAFRDFMRETGLKVEDRVVYQKIKKMGFKNAPRRFGPKLKRVWTQALEGGDAPSNGNGHPAGPAEPTKPEEPVKSPPGQPELFEAVKDSSGNDTPSDGAASSALAGDAAQEDVQDFDS